MCEHLEILARIYVIIAMLQSYVIESETGHKSHDAMFEYVPKTTRAGITGNIIVSSERHRAR